MTDLESLRVSLGIADAPLVRAGLATVDSFFRNTLHEEPSDWLDYLRGIDFHQPIRTEWLERGTRLIRYDSTGKRTLKPFLYFTKSGTSPHVLGTSFPTAQYKQYEVDRRVLALVSKANGVKFGPRDSVSRLGGGQQYIVSFADAPALARVGSTR